ncbi:hypothetical protein [Paraflavitalea speifideaquila]|uniref:hypothetical protein n=1 Tax=Paraflavitalea speifideaquila TaxID=3076558 RepID=UPI0028E600B2|nr:hypothetical protein [Paraflavitalea speifideiaquila]
MLSDLTYKDSTGSYPKAYSDRNYLDYYVNRNIEVIKYLQKQPWILRSTLVAAGHSEGATIVAKLASTFPRITHLIYSGGNPMGRIASIVVNSRRYKNNFTFKGYIGTEHNFFGVNPDSTTNYNAFNWDKVALDWLH